MRQAAVQWVGGRHVVRHRLLPLAATASHTVFPAAASSLSLSLINYGPQLQQQHHQHRCWALPVTSFRRDDDLTLVALGDRDAALKRDDGERSTASIYSSRCVLLR